MENDMDTAPRHERAISLLLRHPEAGMTMAGIVQFLVVIGLLAGLLLMGSQIKSTAHAVMTISRIKQYDQAVRTFRDQFGALPGDIRDARSRLPGCQALPCAAAGNGDNVVADRKALLSSPFYFRDTSENRTFWLHMAKAGLIGDVKKDGQRGQYFGQWGIDFPAAPLGIPGGFHIAYYSVSATYSPVRLLGHYMVLRGATDTYGAASAPYALTPAVSAIIDKKMDDGKPLSGRVAGVGAKTCNDGGVYNTGTKERACNLLFQLSF